MSQFSSLYPLVGVLSSASDMAWIIHAIYNTDFLNEKSRAILNTEIKPTGCTFSFVPGFIVIPVAGLRLYHLSNHISGYIGLID